MSLGRLEKIEKRTKNETNKNFQRANGNFTFAQDFNGSRYFN